MSLVRRSVEYSAAALAVEIVLGRGGRTGKALLLLDGHGIFCAAAVQLERAFLLSSFLRQPFIVYFYKYYFYCKLLYLILVYSPNRSIR